MNIMPIDCKDFLNGAKKILNSSDCECDYRNAISRAYYSIYHHAQNIHNLLPTGGCLPPVEEKRGLHETLYYQLAHPTVLDENSKKISKSVGYILKDIKTMRVKADYRLDSIVSKGEAELAIKEAQRAHTKLL